MSRTRLHDLQALLLDRGKASYKINTIKQIRAMTGVGLKEAKEFYEQVWEPLLQGNNPDTVIVNPSSSMNPTDDMLNRLEKLEKQVHHLLSNQPTAMNNEAKTLFNT